VRVRLEKLTGTVITHGNLTARLPRFFASLLKITAHAFDPGAVNQDHFAAAGDRLLVAQLTGTAGTTPAGATSPGTSKPPR
jgi:hypothetical protein